MNQIATLRDLYMRESKHSNYQVLPRRVRQLLGSEAVATLSRFECERMAFVAANVDFAGQSVLDMGANTGYFSIESLDLGARSVLACEGNAAHAEFLRLAAAALGDTGRLTVANAYLQFPQPHLPGLYGVGLLMNVLHHVGDDFGDRSLDAHAARRFIGESLRNLAGHCSRLVFQLGYCWKGDRSLPLFRHGTKQEQIDFVADETAGSWSIEAIGIPQVGPQREVAYMAPCEANLRRRDDWGEFLNRPLFILKSGVAPPSAAHTSS
jgi:SAM-dependent methyltransferase